LAGNGRVSRGLRSGKPCFHSGCIEVDPILDNPVTLDMKDIGAPEDKGHIVPLASGFESDSQFVTLFSRICRLSVEVR